MVHFLQKAFEFPLFHTVALILSVSSSFSHVETKTTSNKSSLGGEKHLLGMGIKNWALFKKKVSSCTICLIVCLIAYQLF